MSLSSKPLVDFAPVDDVPPGIDVVGSAILILEVIGVLPHVHSEDDLLPFHQWTVLVRAALDRQLVAGRNDPRPSAAKPADAGLLELFLELVEAAKRRRDGFGDGAGRRPAGTGAHHLPKHRVVGVSASVVAHGSSDVLRHAVDIAEQLFDALSL